MSAPAPGPHASAPVLEERIEGTGEGAPLGLLLLHGRGGSASDIVSLGHELVRRATRGGEGHGPVPTVHLAAPQASDRSWYPGSFLEPLEHNEPWLSSALAAVESTSRRLAEAGVPRERQILVGLSQGACLACEFVGRSALCRGGLIAFTGGFQGPLGRVPDFEGNFAGTPMFFGTGSPDPHVPLARVEQTADRFEQMGAQVDRLILTGCPHSISVEELARAVHVLSNAV